MIQIEKIEITDFRGIRHLVLDLKKNSFGISGPNGTGKSGVVDAIEFALTGSITRLGGAGTAELSVKAHAPHVDSASKPEKAVVALTAYLPAQKKSFTIERSVRAYSNPKITPDDASTRAAVAKLQTHPEFALSRREIIKYILTPAGKRNTDVQVLLRLDQIEEVRTSLQRVANDAKRELKRAQDDDERTKADFIKHLGILKATKAELLAAVNARRAILKLNPLSDLTPETSIKVGVTADKKEEQPKTRPSKVAANADLSLHSDYASKLSSDDFNASISAISKALDALTFDPDILKGFRQKVLVEQGIALIDDEVCPLCDTAWDLEKLKAHLQEKLAKASAASAILEELTKVSAPVLKALGDYVASARQIVKLCDQADPKIDAKVLTDFTAVCKADHGLLEELVGDPSLIADVRAILARKLGKIPKPVTDLGNSITAYVQSLPDPSTEDAAKEYLIVAQEKYERCQATKAEVAAATGREQLATKVFKEFGDVSTKALEAIYDAVQKNFTSYYSFINRDDEEKFEGKLTPSLGKLAFDVDFYGRGKFPPGAYHSEGHQDGMGLCLYLALMIHTLGDDFVLAVLDDVLMSVDAGHRREVCELLKKFFPNTQFILTTHDPVWLQFMSSEKLIQGSINFGGWSVDTGPQVWREGDVWTQIDEKLVKNDVAGAAGTLRRYLEYISTILADKLHARVHYHSNGSYDLGDLWPAVTFAWKERLEEAKKSAQSWGASTKEIEAMQADAKAKIAATNSEQWMINKALHYNEWHNLQAKEFKAVADAFKDLLASMQCSNAPCHEFVCVTPARGREREALRCGCGQRNHNLKMK